LQSRRAEKKPPSISCSPSKDKKKGKKKERENTVPLHVIVCRLFNLRDGSIQLIAWNIDRWLLLFMCLWLLLSGKKKMNRTICGYANNSWFHAGNVLLDSNEFL
jgi:hypothetical protein